MKKLLYSVSFAALYALATTNSQATTLAEISAMQGQCTMQGMPTIQNALSAASTAVKEAGEVAVAVAPEVNLQLAQASSGEIAAQALEDDSDDEEVSGLEMDDSMDDSDDEEASDMALTEDDSNEDSSEDDAEAPAVDTISTVSIDNLVTQGQTVAQIKNVLAKALQELADQLLADNDSSSSSDSDDSVEAPEVEAPEVEPSTALQSIDLTDLSSDSDDNSENEDDT